MTGATQLSSRRPLLGVLLFAVLTPALGIVWIAVLLGVGSATDSGPLGICGPFGPLGDLLLLALLAGLIGTPFTSLTLARRILDIIIPMQDGTVEMTEGEKQS